MTVLFIRVIVEDMKQIFNRLRNFGFRLNRKKCFFAKSEVKYLGHIRTYKEWNSGGSG